MASGGNAGATAAHGPELVFAFVAPVGTPTDEVQQRLAGDLLAYGYRVEVVKLSGILAKEVLAQGRDLVSSPEDARIGALMDEGDKLCEEGWQAVSVVLLGMAEMRNRRAERHSAAGVPGSSQELQELALERTAWVLYSLKRPAEVERLRQTYGDHLILLGLKASDGTRRGRLRDKIRVDLSTMSNEELDEKALGLIGRDLAETGEYGQNTLRAYPMADVFLDVDKNVGGQVGRLLELLFGSPDFQAPDRAEFGMHLAHVSSTRTGELGLKVGAALLRLDGSVVALGVNRHPKPNGSPAYDASALDIRALVIDTLNSLRDQLGTGTRDRLDADADLLARELLKDQLRGSKVAGLIEFQPPVHAEMDALLGALRGSHSVDGATLFVTAYPCHNCAKHLVALGLEVRYLEPYPKSKAYAMYGTAVESAFQPFMGVAPRRYEQLFETAEDRKSPDGGRKPWGAAEKAVAQPRVDPFIDQRGISDREVLALEAVASAQPAAGADDLGSRSVGAGAQDVPAAVERPLSAG